MRQKLMLLVILVAISNSAYSFAEIDNIPLPGTTGPSDQVPLGCEQSACQVLTLASPFGVTADACNSCYQESFAECECVYQKQTNNDIDGAFEQYEKCTNQDVQFLADCQKQAAGNLGGTSGKSKPTN